MTDVAVGEQPQVADSQNAEAVAQTLYAESIAAEKAEQSANLPAEAQATAESQTKPADTQQDQKAQDKGQQSEGAPERYEFTAPDGQALDKAAIDAFAEAAKEAKLPQKQAQAIIDKVAPVLAQQQAQALKAVSEQWVNSSIADQEFGGEQIQANLGIAKKGMEQFASDGLKQLLSESQLGNHPEVIRMFYRIGKAMSEDRMVTGRATKAPLESHADRLYGSSQH